VSKERQQKLDLVSSMEGLSSDVEADAMDFEYEGNKFKLFYVFKLVD
jgi:hypothetical protein